MPTIEEIIEAQRVKLAGGLTPVVSRIAGAYTQAAATATHRLETTTSELTRQRMSILLSGIEDELTKAGAKTIPLIKGQQDAQVLEASKDFGELLQHMELAARLDPLANERMFAALSPESPLAQLLAKANQAGLTEARKALFTGVALGDNPRKIAPRLREALDIPRWRAQTIARTEVLRSYRGSMTQRMKEQGFGHWRWISARDRRTCAMCWAMHGTVHPVDESFGSHPNCRCSPAPIDTGAADTLTVDGRADFAKLSEAEQRNILGTAKFKAWDSGAIDLLDLVGMRQDAKWGLVRYEKSLLSILGNAAGPFYKGGSLPSNFQKQLLKQHEDAVAKAEQHAQQLAAEAMAAQKALEAAQQAQLAAQEQIKAAKEAATAKAAEAAKKGAVTAAKNKLVKAQQAVLDAGGKYPGFEASKKLNQANALANKYGLPHKQLYELMDLAKAGVGSAANVGGNVVKPVAPAHGSPQWVEAEKQKVFASGPSGNGTMTQPQQIAALKVINAAAAEYAASTSKFGQYVQQQAAPAGTSVPAGNLTSAQGQYTFETRGGFVSYAEQQAASAYQDGQYTAWNRYLRETAKGQTPSLTPSANGLNQMKTLDELLTRSRVTDSTLYRRVNTPLATLRQIGLEAGKDWPEHGYMSTSGSNIGSFGQTQYIITIPPGVQAKGYLMPTMGSENERLLMRGSNFHVDRVDEANAKIYMTYKGVLGE